MPSCHRLWVEAGPLHPLPQLAAIGRGTSTLYLAETLLFHPGAGGALARLIKGISGKLPQIGKRQNDRAQDEEEPHVGNRKW